MQAESSQMDIIVHRVFPIGGGLRLATAATPSQRKAKLRVLVVEDDEADVYLIRRALANNPRIQEVVVARDGVEALELIESWSAAPDLAIVDLHMPRKDGFALLRDFSMRKSDPFPAVVLTSSKAGADAFRSKKRGAVEFVTKPNTVEKLTTALDQVISRI
jgi:two-component system, response regulator